MEKNPKRIISESARSMKVGLSANPIQNLALAGGGIVAGLLGEQRLIAEDNFVAAVSAGTGELIFAGVLFTRAFAKGRRIRREQNNQ